MRVLSWRQSRIEKVLCWLIYFSFTKVLGACVASIVSAVPLYMVSAWIHLLWGPDVWPLEIVGFRLWNLPICILQ